MKEMNFLDQINHDKLFLVVIETTIRYLREAVLFDELTVETSMKIEKPYLVFRHRILNRQSGELLSRATIKTIFINKQRVPLDIPSFIFQNISNET